MATDSQKAPCNLGAIDALAKIKDLAEAALCLTANSTERGVQLELIGVIHDIASTITEGGGSCN
ncbi:hypothetical protein IV04_21670 [Serratia sp. Ag1]|nr:hypothetical protein IV04_21670 [Serratia sp. Ag1]KFK96016.1 hypothetical protein JV45_06360 [Serratia sp. Ag2]